MTDFVEYPRWLYHKTLPAKIIETPEEWEDDWFTTPEEAQASGSEKTGLIAQAEALGIKIDKRWSAEKIQAAITQGVVNDNASGPDQSSAQAS